jgi:SAM-dependent methyltransferase
MNVAGVELLAETAQDTAALIERNIAAWDALYAQNPRWNRYPSEELAGFIARMFPDPAGLNALEVGCGPGANLWFLAREGFNVAGIDGSTTAINAARDRLIAEGITTPADLRIDNFALLPWSDRTFDVVIDIQSISHNTTPVIESVVDEIHRVLKPGGWFFGRMFADTTTGILSGKKIDEKTTHAAQKGPLSGCGIVHGFSGDELESLLSGFTSVRLDWVHRRAGKAFDIVEWIVQAQRR